MEIVHEPALGKVNLCLHLVGRRSDGYHLLESCVGFINIADEVFIEKSPLSHHLLSVKGPFATELYKAEENAENLAMRALRVFERLHPIPVYIHIQLIKNLPVAAGLGGGSADAAAVLRGVNQVCGHPFSLEELKKIGIELGADVPMCIDQKACWVSGVGEVVNPLEHLLNYPIVLVNPNKPLSTVAVFQTWRNSKGDFSPPLQREDQPLEQILIASKNDLEGTAETLCPEIQEIKQALHHEPGCWVTRLSGSGATCFGLYHTAEQAKKAAERIKEKNPNYWVVHGRVS